MTLENDVMNVQEKCMNGEITPIDAVNHIDSLIGGITRVFYNSDFRFKIDNHVKRFSLKYAGKKSQTQYLHAMAALAYVKAMKNGNIMPGEVRIGRGVSTKHYKGGITALVNQYSGAN